ncbi:DgyrCDS767 [Dimorphilus gyrociliatus]|uniref:DgyrCDS767 n=1 Tax=Dimorphilus gyrociliatus TaxID=2664684 RepID=A0A7I8V857_9ANNE|nr:DgyrCDS767 [Dimorphilus gyrociliatus]
MTDDKADVLSLTDDEENELEDELPIKQGVLSKWTNYIHGWQDRFIVLKSGTLSYYKSEHETKYGCRGAVSLAKAIITPHEYDECRVDVSVNDSVWYLRAENNLVRNEWIEDMVAHKKEINDADGSLRRHGSVLSLTSGTSMSNASTSSFKRGRGLRERLLEIETFRDILCRQVEGLQNYFDACASAVQHGVIEDLEDIGDPDENPQNNVVNGYSSETTSPFMPFSVSKSSKDIASILRQHGAHAIDFKGESNTFKATTAGIMSTLSHCIEIMNQREEAWRKRLDKEMEKRKKYQEAYKQELLREQQVPKTGLFSSPDYEEGPHSKLKEEEFYDAVEAALDTLDRDEEVRKQRIAIVPSEEKPLCSLPVTHELYPEIKRVVDEHIRHADLKGSELTSDWQLIAEEGEMKVYKRELEENGVVVDPIRAVHTVSGVTGHEMCHVFWDPSVRMEWETTLEDSKVVEWLSKDTLISFQLHKRMWPSSQRDSLFWTTIQHYHDTENDDGPEYWVVVNKTTEHVEDPKNSKWIRIRFNVSLICETVVKPPVDGKQLTRDNVSCKVQYAANINPGGWAPASVVRALSKREIPKFLRTFTKYVQEKTKNEPIML